MATKLPPKILALLREARDAATLENASFDSNASTDTFIKDRVRLHHASWIIRPLNQAIKWAETKRK